MADAQPALEYSDHAAEAMRERNIDPAWVERVIEKPSRVEPDALDTNATHALASIPEFGDRVLRVIYNDKRSPWTIITVYFDRRMKGRL